jgi:hypothetical protein
MTLFRQLLLLGNQLLLLAENFQLFQFAVEVPWA